MRKTPARRQTSRRALRSALLDEGYGTLLEAAPDAMLVVDREGRVVLVNESAIRLFGYSRTELRTLTIESLMPEKARGLHAEHREAFFSHPQARHMGAGLDLRGRRKDGSEFAAEITLAPARTATGMLVTAAVRDVTDRVRADVMFRGLLEAAPDAIVIVDPEDRIMLVNAQLERLFDLSRADLIGKNAQVLFPLRFRTGPNAIRLNLQSEAEARQLGAGLDLCGRRCDGSEFPVEINVSPLDTDHGRLASAAIRDVSDRIRAHELTMRLATIVDSTDDAIVSKTLDGIVTSWNPAAQRIFGWHADEIVGRPIHMIIPPGREAEETIILQGLREGRSFQTYETVRRRKDGRDVEVSVTISPLRDANGEVIGASKIARDITRRKANERSVARAKEEAEIANRELEAFSYSVAHDLRAPLRSIDGFSRSLLSEHFSALNDEAQKNLGRVRDSAQHMSHLIDALLDLSRISRTELRLRPVDLAALARESVRRLREQQPERIVEVTIEDELQTSGDPRLLGVLMDNLLGNAWKFTAHALRAQIEFGVELDDAGMIYFVRDNGAGFDMTYAPKLFNVFQRLHRREEYEGTGIGLATVQRIVHRHSGRIWAHGEVNRGATFYFTLQDGVSNGQQGSLLF